MRMSDTGRPPVLVELAARARQTYRVAGPEDRQLAAHHALDTLGCCLVGRGHPMAGRLGRSLADLGSVGPCQPVGLPALSLPVDTAAAVDAMLAHVDEYDGFHSAAAVVPAAVVVPAAFAVARHEGLAGGRFLDAVLAGYEVVVETGLRFTGPQLYGSSWWPTALFGAIGAAAATSVLLDLDEESLTTALCIAAAGTGGLLSDAELSEGHHLLVGNAVGRGVAAAYQSRAGMSAARTLLDGPASRALGRRPLPPQPAERVHLAGCSVKPYPCARPLHAVIDALHQLADSGVDLESLTAVRIGLPGPLLAFVSDDKEVAGPSEAAASAAFAVAAAIAGRESDVTFYRNAVLTPTQKALTVTIAPDAELDLLYPEQWGATVTLFRAAAPDARSVTVLGGQQEDQEALVLEKFRRNARDLKPAVMSAWQDRLLHVDDVTDMSVFHADELESVVR